MNYFYKRKLRKIVTETCVINVERSLDLIKGMDWYVLPSLGSKELTEEDIQFDKIPKLYWQKIIDYSNIIAFTTLTRNNEWIRGVASANKEENFYSYCANLRSLIESSADAYYTLKNLPLTLSSEYRTIFQSIHDDIEFNYIDPGFEMEQDLRHFIYASKIDSHDDDNKIFPKSARDYLNSLNEFLDNEEFAQLIDLWSVLCEVVHPAAFSVNTFINQQEDISVLVKEANWSEIKLLNFTIGAKEILSKILEEVIRKCFLVMKITDLFVEKPETYNRRYIGFLNDTQQWKICLDEIAKSEEKYLDRLNRMED